MGFTPHRHPCEITGTLTAHLSPVMPLKPRWPPIDPRATEILAYTFLAPLTSSPVNRTWKTQQPDPVYSSSPSGPPTQAHDHLVPVDLRTSTKQDSSSALHVRNPKARRSSGPTLVGAAFVKTTVAACRPPPHFLCSSVRCDLPPTGRRTTSCPGAQSV